MSKRLRWAIMGTGNIARQFCAAVAASAQRSELAAAGSRTRDAAGAFADAYRISRAYGSYDELLADRDVDAVYISLPNSLHHEWTLKSLAAGKHVLCEKPFAVNAAQSEEMFAAADQRGLLLMEAFMYRSHPQTQRVLDIIRGGEIGPVRLIRTSFCYRTTRIDDNIRFRADLAGGALMDVGCYCISFSRLLAGNDPLAVTAAASMHERGIDQGVVATMRFPGGVLASFACAMNIQADNSAHICGEEGYVQIGWPWKPPRSAHFTMARGIPPRQDQRAGSTAPPPPRIITVDADRDLYALEADDFAAAVLDGAPPRVTRDETLGVMRVLDEMRGQIGLAY